MFTAKLSHAEFVTDWMNFTAKELGKRVHAQVPMPDGIGTWQPTNAVHGYNVAYMNEFGARCMWSTEREDMGIHVMYPGKTINKYLAANITPRHILAHHANFGDVCKRIDLAIDVRDSQLSIVRLFNQLKSGDATTRAKTYNLITGNTGDTLYVGSRTSDLFLRIYDKGAQMLTSDNWKRVELEIKGTRAVIVAREFASRDDNGVFTMTKSLIAGMCQFDDDTWRSLVGDLALRLGKAQDNSADTAGWLLGQVAPAMARYMNETGDFDVLDKFLLTVHALTGTLTNPD